jgi:hypothetical protein
MPAATTTTTIPVAPCSRGGSVEVGRVIFSPTPWLKRLPLSCYKREEIDDADLKPLGLVLERVALCKVTPNYRRVTLLLPSRPSHPGCVWLPNTSGSTSLFGNYIKEHKAKADTFLAASINESPAQSVHCLSILYSCSKRKNALWDHFICLNARFVYTLVCCPYRFKILPDHNCHRTSLYSYLLFFWVFSRSWDTVPSRVTDYKVVWWFYWTHPGKFSVITSR